MNYEEDFEDIDDDFIEDPAREKASAMQQLALITALHPDHESRGETMRAVKKTIRQCDKAIAHQAECDKAAGRVFDIALALNQLETLTIEMGWSDASLPGTQLVRVAKAGSMMIMPQWAVGLGGVTHNKRFYIGDTPQNAIEQALEEVTRLNEERKAKKRGSK